MTCILCFRATGAISLAGTVGTVGTVGNKGTSILGVIDDIRSTEHG